MNIWWTILAIFLAYGVIAVLVGRIYYSRIAEHEAGSKKDNEDREVAVLFGVFWIFVLLILIPFLAIFEAVVNFLFKETKLQKANRLAKEAQDKHDKTIMSLVENDQGLLSDEDAKRAIELIRAKLTKMAPPQKYAWDSTPTPPPTAEYRKWEQIKFDLDARLKADGKVS